jgi:hypothetical protein
VVEVEHVHDPGDAVSVIEPDVAPW